MKKKVYAFGIGLRRQRNKTTLDVLFPLLARDTVTESFDALYENIQAVSNHETDIFTPLSESQLKQLSSQEAFDRLRHFPTKNTSSYYKTDIGLFVLSSANTAIQSTEEAYLKLQLLSQRLNTPHSLSLDGLFGVLENIAWTNKGPILIEDITQERLKHLASDSPLKVSHIDKFPYLVDYACPSGVRIASGSQVRLGAYLAEGTTVMPAGYVNFNAGSLEIGRAHV